MNELFLKVINMSMSASWLILAVLLLRVALKKAPKWVNVLLWGIVAVRLICPFTMESPISLIPDSIGNGELVSRWMDDYIGDVDIHQSNSMYYDDAIGAGRDPIADGEGGSYVVTKHDQLGEPSTIENTVMPFLSVVWAAGMVLLALYTVVSYFRLHRKIDTAVLYRDNIFQSENVSSPFVLGIIRPRIYIPFNMNESDLEHVIAHEKAHIYRKDHWWKPLGFLLVTIHWFNPLIWLAYVLLCRDIELACDEKVIRGMDNGQKASYAQALVTCSVNRHMIAACPLAFGEANVKERVKSVMNYKKPAFWMIAIAAIACIVLSVCFLTNPISIGDYFVLKDVYSIGEINSLSYDVHLGKGCRGGELYAEQWINGTVVSSIPVILTEDVESIHIIMQERKEGESIVGTDIQIDTNQYEASLLTYFAHPDGTNVVGWSLKGHEANQKNKLSVGEEAILATLAFDTGNGVESYGCETLISEPDRLMNAENMIVIRAVFHDMAMWDCSVTCAETSNADDYVITYSDKQIISQTGALSFQNQNNFDIVVHLLSQGVDEWSVELPPGNGAMIQVGKDIAFTAGLHADVPEGTGIRLMVYDGEKTEIDSLPEGVPEDTLIVNTYEVTDSELVDDNLKNDELITIVKYYEMSDGTWKTDNYTYQYRLEITGRMGGAEKDSTFVFLSNIDNISFEQAWKAAGFSSNMNDYFKEKDAKLVAMK